MHDLMRAPYAGGLPIACDKSQPSRIGLLARADPRAPVRWFDIPSMVVFHVANAWERDGLVQVALCRCVAACFPTRSVQSLRSITRGPCATF